MKVREAVERWLWENCTINEKRGTDKADRNCVPIWSLARKVVLGKDKQQGAMARSVNIHTQWTQSRINPTDPICRACSHPLYCGTMKHRNFPNVVLCCESLKHVDKHLPLTVIEHLKTGFGGEMLAKYAILTTEHLPSIPTVVDKEPQWLREDMPKSFTGTAYTDGSASITHGFKKARRAGWAALVIAEELPHTL